MFIDELVKQGYKYSTINRTLATLRSFGHYLCEVGGILHLNPCRKLKDFTLPEYKPKGINGRDYHRIMKSADLLVRDKHKMSQGFRNMVLIEAYKSSGLRCFELIQLKLGQFNSKRTLKNCRLKNNIICDVTISTRAGQLISEYIACYRPKSDTDYIFVSCRGKMLDRSSVWRALNKIETAANASIKDKESRLRIFPHLLRHTHGYLAYSKGGKDLLFVQRRLHHKSLQYIPVYAQDPDVESKEMKVIEEI